MGFPTGNHKKFTKQNEILLLTKQNETKRNFAVFVVSRNKRNFAKQFFCFGLFRVSRNKKKDAKWKPYPRYAPNCADSGLKIYLCRSKSETLGFLIEQYFPRPIQSQKLCIVRIWLESSVGDPDPDHFVRIRIRIRGL
jgi:hypothetical protein